MDPDRIRIQLWIRLLSSLILRMQKKIIFSHFFLIGCLQVHHLQTKRFNFLQKFCVKMLFCRHYFSSLNTFMRKGKDPHLLLIDPDPGGPKTCGYGSGSGSGSPTLFNIHETEPWYHLFPVSLCENKLHTRDKNYKLQKHFDPMFVNLRFKPVTPVTFLFQFELRSRDFGQLVTCLVYIWKR